MERSPEALANSKKGFASRFNINLLEVMVILFSIAVIFLGIVDIDFRSTLRELAVMVISGYLGSKVPR